MTPEQNLERTRLLFAELRRSTPESTTARTFQAVSAILDGAVVWRAEVRASGPFLGDVEMADGETQEQAVVALAALVLSLSEERIANLTRAIVDFGGAEVASKVRRRRPR